VCVLSTGVRVAGGIAVITVGGEREGVCDSSGRKMCE